MSRFKTDIPVDVEGMKQLLPKGAFLHSVKLCGSAVVLEWEHEHFKTPYTFAVDFPKNTLELHTVPPGVVYCGPKPAAQPVGGVLPQKAVEPAQPVDSPRVKREKKRNAQPVGETSEPEAT